MFCLVLVKLRPLRMPKRRWVLELGRPWLQMFRLACVYVSQGWREPNFTSATGNFKGWLSFCPWFKILGEFNQKCVIPIGVWNNQQREKEKRKKKEKMERSNSEASQAIKMKDGPRIFVKSSLFADTVQINHSVSFSLFLARALKLEFRDWKISVSYLHKTYIWLPSAFWFKGCACLNVRFSFFLN